MSVSSWDIVLDTNENLQADATGMDFLVGDNGNKQMMYIVVAAPGHYKEFPWIGANINAFLNGNFSQADIVKAIRTQLEADIFKNPLIDATRYLVDGSIYVNRSEIIVNS